MPHGEFWVKDESGDIRVIPNQFTIIGMQQVLKGLFWGETPDWSVGLCAHNPADSVALSVMREPAIGVNGYARQTLPMNKQNWPSVGVLNGESYVESRVFTFPLTAELAIPVNRLFITDGVQVIAISSPIEGGLQLLSAEYQNSYRLYFR